MNPARLQPRDRAPCAGGGGGGASPRCLHCAAHQDWEAHYELPQDTHTTRTREKLAAVARWWVHSLTGLHTPTTPSCRQPDGWWKPAAGGLNWRVGKGLEGAGGGFESEQSWGKSGFRCSGNCNCWPRLTTSLLPVAFTFSGEQIGAQHNIRGWKASA